jgi:CubicO group peptidase (beta-lactamase class C family)
MRKRASYFVGLLFCAHFACASEVASDAAIRGMLSDRIDRQHQSVGIVVGVIEPAGRRIVAYGKRAVDDERPLDGDTVFEIGSITKVFTSLLLADMVERGEVALSDPIAKYLPEDVKVPAHGAKIITLEHLATHTSALPRLPSNLEPNDADNPYADYTVRQLYAYLSSASLSRDPGMHYEYSNLGAGLLGHALARRAGRDYESLVRARILAPLGMDSSSVTLTNAMKERLAVGHDATLERTANWDLPTLAGAGALRSTANDLLTFLGANLGEAKTLAKPMARMIAARRPTGTAGMDIALGWHIATIDGRDIVWHNGGTGGFRSYIGFDPKRRVGVVVLSNASTNAGVDDIGRHLLVPTSALAEGPKVRKEVVVDPKVLDGYVGRYELAPNFVLTVTRDGSQLFVQATGQPMLEVFAESDRKFFYKAVDAQITFAVDEQGRATSLVLDQNGADVPGKRIAGAAPSIVSVAPEVLQRYVGRYQLAPNFILAVTREESRLFVQATNQPRLEVFAKSEREFFYKAVDAQITFVIDGTGRSTSLVLHQNGAHMPAQRLE